MAQILRQAAACLLTAVLLLALCAPAGAKEATVRVAYTDYNNYLCPGTDGQMYGYCADYLELVAQVAGWQLEYVDLPWNEALTQVKQGDVDLVCSASYSPQRADHYSFSTFPSATEQYLLLTLPENDLYYEDFTALDGATIGILDGTLTADFVDQYTDAHAITCQTQPFPDINAMLEALRSGAVDAVAITNLVPHDGLRPIANLAASPVYFMSRANSPVMTALNRAVAHIKSTDPTFDARLLEQYYGQNTTSLPPLTRQEAAYAATHSTVTVGVYAGRGPFYIGKNGTGLYAEILELLSARTGIRFKPVVMNGSINDCLASGNYDLMIVMAGGSWATDGTQIRCSEPFFDLQTTLLGRQGTTPDLTGPLKLGIAQQFSAAVAHLRQTYPQYSLRVYPDVRSCLHAVLKGDIDVMADSSYLLGYQLQNPKYNGLSVLSSDYLDDQSYFLALDGTPDELLQIVNKALALIPSAEITRMTTYYSNLNNTEISLWDSLYPFRYSLWLIGALCAACLLLLLVVWRYRTRASRIADDNRLALLSSQAKSDFLSRMSHELRTPMNAIVGLAGLTLDMGGIPESARENLSQIDASSQYLLGLVNDILDMARIENAKLELSHEIVSYEEFRSALFSIIAPQAARKGVTFTCTHNHPGCPHIYSDKMRLTQIFVNLLNNAIKFTPSGGMVELIIDTPARDETHVSKRFTVRDNGVGISPAFVSKMFQPFELERTTNNAAGTGLGLAIVKNLVDLMGGTISVSSELGKGTEIVVDLRFPIAPPPSRSTTVGSESPDSALAGRHVLLVEDHPVNQLVARKLLEKSGATVDTANNGKEALVRFLSAGDDRYAYIFMDIQMPEMNGYECTRAIRNSHHPRARTVPIVAMTANAFVSDISKCLHAGMNAHIGKPITLGAIEAALRSIEV